MKTKLLWGAGLLGVVSVGLVIAGKRADALDPLHGEASKAAKMTSPTVASEEPDKAASNQRWRQRVAERAANNGAAAAAPQRPDGSAALGNDGAGRMAHDSGVADNGVVAGSAAPGGREAGLQDGQQGLRPGGTGAFVNAKAGGDAYAAGAAQPRSPSKSTGAAFGNSGSALPPTTNALAKKGCGDGVIEAGEECEPASTPKCGDDCRPVVSEACYNCELNSVCVAISSLCVDAMTSELDQSLCYDVAHCIQDTGCASGANTLTSCFCGDMTLEQCRNAPVAGDQAPRGACADIIRQAMGPATSNVAILTHYTSNATPAGAAIKRFQCLKSVEACSQVCFPK